MRGHQSLYRTIRTFQARLPSLPTLKARLSSTSTRWTGPPLSSNTSARLDFIRTQTRLLKLNEFPLALKLALPGSPLFEFTESDLETWQLPPPFWAFYWPGGQALTHYLAESKVDMVGQTVLDLGSGCGASSIVAAVRCGAGKVVANDIDGFCSLALQLNVEDTRTLLSKDLRPRLDRVHPLSSDLLTHSNPWPLVTGSSNPPETILVGDMFYDREIADLVLSFLARARNEGTWTVLIGDPGRWAFRPATDSSLQGSSNRLTKVASYPIESLPGFGEMHRENDGFATADVYSFS